VRSTGDGEEALLMVRVEALLRRSRPSLAGDVLVFGDLELDSASHRVHRGGETLHLGPTELKLLRYFMERPNRVLSRQQILDGVWGMDSDIDERTVDVHIRRLRKAINRDDETDPIRTVRAAGYSMDAS
jgi:two-component system phosphate regulon response regulator PhoB